MTARIIPFPDRGHDPALPLFLVARHYNVSLRTVQRWVRQAGLSEADGRVTLSAVQQWLDERKDGAA